MTIYPIGIYEKTGTQNIEIIQGHACAKVWKWGLEAYFNCPQKLGLVHINAFQIP